VIVFENFHFKIH